MANKYRDHYINELTKSVGEEVRVAGFVENIRDHGGVIFVDVNTGVIKLDTSEEKTFDNKLYIKSLEMFK